MIPPVDLETIDRALAPLWPRLEGARLFFTGATGFIGRWMLEALRPRAITLDVTVLSRDPAGFARRAPHLAARCTTIEGDVLRGFTPPPGRFTHVIHGATDASAHRPRPIRAACSTPSSAERAIWSIFPSPTMPGSCS
jgi:dTDP-glucose 4,6-dehydratase